MSVRDRGDDADAALSYRAVVDAVAGEDEKVAEGFFDLANAPLVRYDVAPSAVEARASPPALVLEQDQSLHNSCGGIVWESAFCLAQYLRRGGAGAAASRLRGKRVLELGAGCGLAGLAAASAGAASVLLTDHPDALPLLRRNVERNATSAGDGDGDVPRGRPGDDDASLEPSETRIRRPGDACAVAPLDWTDASHLAAVEASGPFDVILAADVVFSVALVGPLLKCIARCAAKTATVLVCLQERCPDAFREFRRRVEKDAFARGGGVAREVPREEVGFVDGACVLFEMTARGRGREEGARRERKEEKKKAKKKGKKRDGGEEARERTLTKSKRRRESGR